MMDTWLRWGTVIITAVAAVPFAAGLIWFIATQRIRRGVAVRRAWLTASSEVVAVAGTLPWLWMILTPGQGPRAVHVVPLADLADLTTGSPSTIVVQLVGNLLVFAAAGFWLPIRFAVGMGTVALVAAASSFAVESAQFILDIGRVSSIDDIIVNTIGAVIAAMLSRHWWLSRRTDRP